MVYRANCNAVDCGKIHGGGTAIFVNQSWCTDSKEISQYCSEEGELLTLMCRPFYLPRELQCIVVSVVYIPPLEKIMSWIIVIVTLKILTQWCPNFILENLTI